MPYAEPTSPVPCDVQAPPPTPATAPRAEPMASGSSGFTFRSTSGPMPGIPRRSSSTSSTSPRKSAIFPAPRHARQVMTGAMAAMRAVESLRRPSPQPSSPPQAGGSLGFKRSPSPRPPSNSGASSDDSSALIITPEDRPVPLPPVPTHSDHSPPKLSLLQRQRQSRQRALSNSSNVSAASSADGGAPHSPERFPMVRKKSGEVVKSSLKQRSMSTPDLGRGNGSSSDSSPAHTRSSHNLRERTKSVRFDDLGLESVVLFLRGQKVTAVSKAAETGQASNGNVNDTPNDDQEASDTDLSDYVHFRTRRSGAASRADDKQVQLECQNTVPRVRLDFGPGTQGLLKNEYVVLERIEMQNGAPLAMRGTVLVRNAAFQKWVAVRFTLDGWQTVSEVSGQHVCHVPAGTTGDEGWDRFSFNIRLEDYKRRIEERSLHLCVRFSVDGREWWDSNGGQNYTINFKRTAANPPPRTSSTSGGSHAVFHSSLHPPHLDSPVPQNPHPHLRLHSRKAPESKGPRSWIFPRSSAASLAPGTTPTATNNASAGAEGRSDSPSLSPPPPVAFKPPAPPDVHTHLQLKKYCAPSPPTSPPKRMHLPQLQPLVLSLAPVRNTASAAMNLVQGHPATSWSPHERSHSWSGKPGAAWQQNGADKQSASDNDESVSGGDSTPRAARARSPETRTPDALCAPSSMQIVESPVLAESTPTPTSSEDEHDRLPTLGGALNRSTGDLRSLVSSDGASSSIDNGLMTPPSSNLSSPPTPSAVLPGPMSPSTSMSTGDSSPINTLTSASPSEGDRNDDASGRGRTLNAATYQEFLDKFCFFKSPPSVTTSLDAPYSRPATYASNSGYSSPYHGYFGSARTTPTPRSSVGVATGGDYNDSQVDGFPFGVNTAPNAGATPRASPPSRSPVTPSYPLPWTPTSETGNVPLATA